MSSGTVSSQDLAVIPLHTPCGWRFVYSFRTIPLDADQWSEVSIIKLDFFYRGRYLGKGLHPKSLALGRGRRLKLEGLIRCEDGVFEEELKQVLCGSVLCGVDAVLEYTSTPTIENPLGNLVPKPLGEFFFSTEDSFEPENAIGKHRYKIEDFTVLDNNRVSHRFRLIGVKVFDGDPLNLCGTSVTKLTPGTPSFTENQSYQGSFELEDLSFTPDSLSPEDQC